MTLIDWAMQFQRQWRHQYLTDEVTVVHGAGSISVRATKIEPGHIVTGEGVKIQTDHFIFQFHAADVSTVNWQRGVRIQHNNSEYEMIVDRNAVYFDDPTEQTLNVVAKKC